MTKIRLFARTFGGNIKVWSIEKISPYSAKISYGLFKKGSSMVNVEVTSEHVDKEIASRVNKKRKEGYKAVADITGGVKLDGMYTSVQELNDDSLADFLNEYLPSNNLDDNYNTKPMKAQPFREGVVKYPAIAQPKLNGRRGVLRWESFIEAKGTIFERLVERAVFRSKEGLEYYFPGITKSLYRELFIYKDISLAFDGELYIPGKSLSYISASCPMINSKGTISNPTNNPDLVSFYSFDLAIPDVSQQVRLKMLMDTLPTTDRLVLVPHKWIYSDAMAVEYRNECIAAGYEGCVIRDPNQEYAFGFRPRFMRKFKTHMDKEFIIIKIYPQENDPTRAMFMLKNDINEHVFECTPVGTDEEHAEYLKNPDFYIGKFGTVRYRERSGVKNVPFHANVIGIRDTEEDS